MELTTDILSLFNKKWGLLCAGSPDDHNAMTISWGGLGTFWGKPVATVYVMPRRHTYSYMEKNDFFTIGFFPEECRKALNDIYGTKSGKNTDKDAEAGFTPVETEHGVIYKEAEFTLVCRKMFAQPMLKENMDDFGKNFYGDAVPHKLYIGEIVDIIRK